VGWGSGGWALGGGVGGSQPTRQSGDAQICPRPAGSACQVAPDSSSSNTTLPALRLVVLATVTELAPLTASAVRLVEPSTPWLLLAQRAGPTMISGDGFAPVASWPGFAPSVFCSVVCPGPAPRSVMPLLIKRYPPPLMVKVPADSCTTWPAGQALIAAWIPLAASEEPFPS